MTITQYVLAGIAAFVLLTIALIGWGLRVGPKEDELPESHGYVDQDRSGVK